VFKPTQLGAFPGDILGISIADVFARSVLEKFFTGAAQFRALDCEEFVSRVGENDIKSIIAPSNQVHRLHVSPFKNKNSQGTSPGCFV
jgi:hypothetical protein